MEVDGALTAEHPAAVAVARLSPCSATPPTSNALKSNNLPSRASPPTTTAAGNSSTTQQKAIKAPDVKLKVETTVTPTLAREPGPRKTLVEECTEIQSVVPRVTPNATLDSKENEKHVRFGGERKNMNDKSKPNNINSNNNTPAPTGEAATVTDNIPREVQPCHRFVSPGRPVQENSPEQPTTAPASAMSDQSQSSVLEYKTFRSPSRKAQEADDEQLPSVASSPSCAQVSTSSSLESAVGEVTSTAEKTKTAPTASISVRHSEATDSPLGQASHAEDPSEQQYNSLSGETKSLANCAKSSAAGNNKSGGLAARSNKESSSSGTSPQHTSCSDVPFSPKSPIVSSSRGFAATEEKKGGDDELLSDSEIEKYSRSMDEFIPQTPKSRDHMSTPTDFTVDYGKTSSGTSFDTSNVLAWLQSPTAHGLFSPGGGLGSILNTPAGAPRTPRTPIVSTSFFFSDVANLPKTGDSPTRDGAKKSKSGISSIICISPLASTRGRTGNSSIINTPLNFKDIFASPRERGSLPLLGDTPSRGLERKPRKSGGDPSLDAVQAERDLLEDEDLNVLLQLAANTPSSKHAGGMDGAIFRSNMKCEDGENFPGLELPMIGNDAEGGTEGKARLRKKMGPRASMDSDTFGSSQLGVRTNSSLGSNKESKSKTGSSNEEARDTNDKMEAAIKSDGSGPLSNSNPYPMVPGFQSHPGEMHAYYPMSGMAHVPPNATGSMRVVVGAAPPHRTSSKENLARPGGSPPPPHPPSYQEFQHPPGNVPYPPPPPGMFGSAYPPYNRMPGARYPPYSHYSEYPPQSQMPMYNAQHSSGSNPKETPKRKNPNPKSAPKPPPTEKQQAKRPAPAAPEPAPTPVASSVTSGVTTEPAPSPPKKAKKSPPGGTPSTSTKKKKSPTLTAKGDREKAAATIQAVNTASGGNNDRAAALAAAILRGVTMRPSGKWQAQLYFAGKSRYIGVFDSREKAALAYEIAREKLKSGPQEAGAISLKSTENLVNAARKAAFDGVNERLPG